MKYLLLIAVVVGVLWLVRGRPSRLKPPASKSPQPAPPAKAVSPQAMVVCAHCGLHLPRSEAVAAGIQEFYCSDAHRRAHGDQP
jgi:uncharacterized protein